MYTVHSLTDTGQGSGLAGDLRYCINQAVDGDTIQFSVEGVINLTKALPDLSRSISIQGPGQDVLTLDGGHHQQILTVDKAATVAISGVTLADGYESPVSHTSGGAIFNQGTLTIDHCAFSGNIADRDSGGAIYNWGTLTVSNSIFSHNGADNEGAIFNHFQESLTVSNSTFSDNGSANGGGGAVRNEGTLTVSGSTFSSNQGAFAGGAIANSGTLALSNSAISGNSALLGGVGGGIYNAGEAALSFSTISANKSAEGGGIANAGTLAVSNSTISGNSCGFPASAGGISNHDGTLTVSNSTISGNQGGGPQSAGGIANYAYGDSAATVTLLDCTLAHNTEGYIAQAQGSQLITGHMGTGAGQATIDLRNTLIAGNGSVPDLFADNGGTFVSDGHNLSNDDGGGLLAGPGDLIHTDPMLGPLQDNGGPTQTMALLPRSRAIGAGDPTNVPATDQRGFSRIAEGAVDIGAFQVQQFVVSTTDDSGPGSLRSAIVNADLAGGSDIEFGVSDTISLTSALPDITRSVRLLGPGASNLTVQRSTATGTPAFRIFTVDGPSGGTQDVTVTLSGLTVAGGQSAAFGGAFPTLPI